MDYKKIIFTKEKQIATITLNTPENFNSFNVSIAREILAALEECEQDSQIRAVIIKGQGPGFCAGGDIKTMVETMKNDDVGDDFFDPLLKILGSIVLKIRSLSKPVIASVHKAVAGAGFSFVLACDFCIAADNTKFIQSFINIGLVPDMGGIYLLNKYLGVNKVTQLVMSGKPILAREAQELGLINEVTSVENLEARTLEFAREYAQGPTQAYGRIKKLINSVAFSDLSDYLKKEAELQIASARTADFSEGVSAFLEKRKPNFTGN